MCVWITIIQLRCSKCVDLLFPEGGIDEDISGLVCVFYILIKTVTGILSEGNVHYH